MVFGRLLFLGRRRLRPALRRFDLTKKLTVQEDEGSSRARTAHPLAGGRVAEIKRWHRFVGEDLCVKEGDWGDGGCSQFSPARHDKSDRV